MIPVLLALLLINIILTLSLTGAVLLLKCNVEKEFERRDLDAEFEL